MDIMELGAIGELVGGIAVIATLIYLAIQVRQTRQVGLALARRETTVQYQPNWDRVSRDPQLFQKGLFHFDELSNADQLAFTTMFGPFVNHLDQTIQMHSLGLETRENVDLYGDIFLAFIQEPGGRQWWEICRPFVVPFARRYLDQRMDEGRLPPRFTEVIPWFAPDEKTRPEN